MTVRIEVIALILLCMAVTQIARVLPFLAVHKLSVPAWMVAWLRLLPAAILAALLIPSLLITNGSFTTEWLRPEIIAAVFAASIGIASRNLVATLLAGMLGYALLENLMMA